MTSEATILDGNPSNTSRVVLFSELLFFFAILPLLLYERLIPNWPIPILVAVAIGALLVLRRIPNFSLGRLFA
jgi:hypothetical protein